MIEKFLNPSIVNDDIRALVDGLFRAAAEADRTACIPDEVLKAVRIAEIRKRYFSEPRTLRDTDLVWRCQTMAALGYGDPALTVALPGPNLTLPILQSLATPAQKDVLFGYFEQTDLAWASFGLTEPQSGSDALKLRTIAKADGDTYRITGRKCYIGNAGRSRYIVVFATLDPDKGPFAVRAFYVPLPAQGVTVEEKLTMIGMRVVRVSEVVFDDCVVYPDQMLGFQGEQDLGRTFLHLQGCFNFMRPGLSSLMLGASIRAIDLLSGVSAELRPGASESARELVKAATHRIRAGLDLCVKAAHTLNRGEDVALMSSLVKVHAVDTSRFIMRSVMNVPDIHRTSEFAALDRMYRDAQSFYMMEGTSDVQRLMIARGARRLLG